MKKKGFTFVELLIVLAIVSILTSISIGSFLSWKKKVSFENDVKKLSSAIQDLRIKAFARKTSFTCSFSPNGKIFYMTDISNNKTTRFKLKNGFQFNGSNLIIDSRGTISGASIKPKVLLESAVHDCVAITDTRVKIGKWDGDNGKCSIK